MNVKIRKQYGLPLDELAMESVADIHIYVGFQVFRIKVKDDAPALHLSTNSGSIAIMPIGSNAIRVYERGNG